MKKLLIPVLMFSCLTSLFAQSITISPTINGSQQSIKVFGDVALSNYPEFVGIRGRGTADIPANTQAGDILFRISGNGFRTVGVNPISLASASIDFFASSDFTNTTGGGEIKFFTGNLTSPSSSSGGYKMILTNNGNLGVGTITPSSKLHISSGTSGVTPSSNAKVFIEDNNHTYINFGTPDNKESGILFGRTSFGGASGGIIYNINRDLNFRTSSNDTRMTITEAGNVGIGTTTPTAKLDVVGDIAVSGEVVGNIKADGEIRLNRATSTTANTSIGFDPFDRQGNSYAVLNTGSGVTVFIRGFTAATLGTMLYLVVAGSGVAIIQDDNATVAANKILTNTSADITISGQGSAIFIYDSGWRLLSFTQ